MRMDKDNPQNNKLGPDISESDLHEVIRKSGYPLQIVVDRILTKHNLDTQLEWTYLDTQTNTERNIDMFARGDVIEADYEKLQVIPQIGLLVECKRSDLPYIFFLVDTQDDWYDVPICTGLAKEEIEISSAGGITSEFDIPLTLSLDELDFCKGQIRRSMSFTKCVRNPKLVLKGDEPFNEIVLPLLKSAKDFKKRAKAPKKALNVDCHLLLCIAVLDAPMIGVQVQDKSNDLVALPWIRVIRSLTGENDLWSGKENEFFIDIVHKDFLDRYLRDYMAPFVSEFGKRVMKHQKVLFKCKGYVKDIQQPIEGQLRTVQ